MYIIHASDDDDDDDDDDNDDNDDDDLQDPFGIFNRCASFVAGGSGLI